MISKTLDSIEKTDIEALIENEVRESRTIEYKQNIPGDLPEEKREFLADISSFANAGGGDLLYGILESEGTPKDAPGIDCNIDTEIQRLENIARDGLDPRIQDIKIVPIEGFPKGPVIIIRIPNSWNSPHMVKYKTTSRFYIRNSAGKHPMDVTEIRNAFLLSEELPERIKMFRDERLYRIISGETPVPLRGNSRLVLHILPIVSFTTKFSIDRGSLERGSLSLQPMGVSGWNSRFNIDGYVTYSGTRADAESPSYCQIFRNGQIEGVYANIATEREGTKYIGSVAFERYIVEATLHYSDALEQLEIQCPIILLLSMTGVKGARMLVSPSIADPDSSHIERDTLILPDVIVKDYKQVEDVAGVVKVLRPVFDAVWNACGYSHSFNYDKDGNWNPR